MFPLGNLQVSVLKLQLFAPLIIPIPPLVVTQETTVTENPLAPFLSLSGKESKTSIKLDYNIM